MAHALLVKVDQMGAVGKQTSGLGGLCILIHFLCTLCHFVTSDISIISRPLKVVYN